jgi:benzoyl-CoA reductase/2-hydroxyglutaryl-CoA dehydratase subunit BcrC/BadD/HgdB
MTPTTPKRKFSFEDCASRAGDRRVGWLCSYTPEELIMAAGFTPVRISAGEKPPSGAEAWLPANICPYVRSIVDEAAGGKFAGLEGMVFVLSCDAMRRLADVWDIYFREGFVLRLDVPRRTDAAAEDFFVEQLRALLKQLEKEAGHGVGEEDLCRAIGVVNETRRLLGAFSRLRDLERAPLDATGFFQVVRAAMTCNKEVFNREAQKFLAQNHEGAVQGGKPRVLLCGCAVDGPSLLEMIEGSGAAVIGDDVCSLMRHYEGEVDTSMEPLRAIARRYLHRTACSRMAGASARVERLLERAREMEIDGVVVHTLKFCDPVLSDLPRLREALQREGIPMLQIERDYSAAPSGQLKTRLEAFVELLASRRRPA